MDTSTFMSDAGGMTILGWSVAKAYWIPAALGVALVASYIRRTIKDWWNRA